MSIAVTYWGFV